MADITHGAHAHLRQGNNADRLFMNEMMCIVPSMPRRLQLPFNLPEEQVRIPGLPPSQTEKVFENKVMRSTEYSVHLVDVTSTVMCACRAAGFNGGQAFQRTICPFCAVSLTVVMLRCLSAPLTQLHGVVQKGLPPHTSTFRLRCRDTLQILVDRMYDIDVADPTYYRKYERYLRQKVCGQTEACRTGPRHLPDLVVLDNL